MTYYTIYKGEEILRVGQCPDNMFKLQIHPGQGERIIEGLSNDLTQKIEFDGFDDDGQPIDPRVVDKTPEKIEESSSPKKLKSVGQ